MTKDDEASEADSKATNKSGVGDEMEVDGEAQSREDNDGRLKRRLDANALVAEINQNSKAGRMLRSGETPDPQSSASTHDGMQFNFY